jgi:hypothetical protein
MRKNNLLKFRLSIKLNSLLSKLKPIRRYQINSFVDIITIIKSSMVRFREINNELILILIRFKNSDTSFN